MKALHWLLAAGLILSAGCFKFDADVKAPERVDLGNWGLRPAEAADQGAIFVAYDSLALEAKPVTLAARLTDYETGRALVGVTVGFYQGSKKLGSAKTGSRGVAEMTWAAPRVGSLLLTARVDAVPDGLDRSLLDIQPVPLRIESIDRDTPIAMVDVAETLVPGSSKDILRGRRPDGGAPGTVSSIARTHTIVYLADRSGLLTAKAKSWFTGHGLPAGVVLQTDHPVEFSDVRRLKTADPHNLKQTFTKIRFGVTGRESIAADFLQEDLRTFLLVRVEAEPDDLREAAEDLRAIPGRRKLNAVDNWRDLQVGVERNRSFPAEALAEQLEQRADDLEQEDD
jgi:hypothetical protein